MLTTTSFSGLVAAGSFAGDGSALTNITRASLATDTANAVVINNVSGIMTSEAELSVIRGGLGYISATLQPPYTYWSDFMGNISPTTGAVTGAVLPAIIGTDTGIFNPLCATSHPVPNTLILRDANGNISGGANAFSQSVTGPAVGQVVGPSSNYVLSGYARTTGASSSPIMIMAPETGFSGVFTIAVSAVISYTNTPGTCGFYTITSRAAYNNGTAPPNAWVVPAVPPIVNYSMDTALTGLSMSFITTGPNLILQVNGVSGVNLDWCVQLQIGYQRVLSV